MRNLRMFLRCGIPPLTIPHLPHLRYIDIANSFLSSPSQRAQELVAVNKNLGALELLHEHVTSKRSRNSPIASLEPVMILFVELCVSLRKGKTAKDGLYQYKNIAQNTSVQTIEVSDCLCEFFPDSRVLLTRCLVAGPPQIYRARRGKGYRSPGTGRTNYAGRHR